MHINEWEKFYKVYILNWLKESNEHFCYCSFGIGMRLFAECLFKAPKLIIGWF